MRIVVCVEQVYDPLTVKISRSREEFDLRQATKKLNPGDRYALEAGFQLRDAAGGEVLALTLGDTSAEDALREAVAMGADHGTLVVTNPQTASLQGAAAATALLAALQRLGPVDLILTGQGSPVDGSGSLAGRLGAVLDCPVVLDVVCLEPAPGGGVQAVIAAGNSAHAVPLPVPSVAAIAAGTQRPRYPTATRIANAYRPDLIDTCSLADLGLDPATLTADTEIGGLVLGPERTTGQTLAGSLDEAANQAAEILKTLRII